MICYSLIILLDKVFGKLKYSGMEWHKTKLGKKKKIFHVSRLFLYSLKTPQNYKYPDVLRRYGKKPVVWNRLKVAKAGNDSVLCDSDFRSCI